MKLLVFDTAKIEGEEEPKVIKLAKIAINQEEILAFFHVIDKYNVPIKDIIHILIRGTSHSFIVYENFNVLVEKVEKNMFE